MRCDHLTHYGMIRLFALIFTLAAMNAALILSATHDGVVTSQQLALEAAAWQDVVPSSVDGKRSCMLNGSCNGDGTACEWTCAAHGAIEMQPSHYGIEQGSRRLDRLFVVVSWETLGPVQQERPPKILSV